MVFDGSELSPSVEGCLVGTAVGDALGLPREGLKPCRARRMFPGPLRHRFLLGRGMVSDDTEHTRMVLRSLREANGDVEKFRKALAWRLRLWLLGVPAGAGMATVRATLRLWAGVPPTRSGVSSAGNGAAMRAAIIGAWFAGDSARRISFVEASSRVTHRDIRAVEGAQAIAFAAARAAGGKIAGGPEEFLTHPAWQEPHDIASGVSGYVVPTVRTALTIVEESPNDYRSAVTRAIEAGGDTDTVAAIVGGIVGTRVGVGGILDDWRNSLFDPPQGTRWYFAAPRNAVFLATVLLHGFRRLLPPY